MNQKQNEILFARVLAVSLVGESQAWNLVKHRPGIYHMAMKIKRTFFLKNQFASINPGG